MGMLFPRSLPSLKDQEKESDKDKIQKIVRIDLLKLENEKIKPPERNIFTGEKIESSPDPEKTAAAKIEQLRPGLDIESGEPEGQEKGPEKIFLHGFKYLGYIASPEKKVALILYEGQAMAVEKGSVLPGGIEIVNISLDNMTVRRSGSEEIVIKLEGEENEKA